MRISIGILAWNEADAIADTLDALCAQALFTEPDPRLESVEVICVPNGCTDDTAAVATRALERASKALPKLPFRWDVRELDQPGKANAWNHYVHEFSDRTADYVLLMDADVTPGEASTLASLVEALEQTPEARVAVPRMVKDIALKPRRTLFERLSLAASDLTQAGPVPLAGGLYCARGATIRQIYLPLHLLVEDGFLRAMILTDQFRSPEDLTRIVRVPEASAVFQAYTTLRQLLRHERRLAMGTALNAILFGELVKLAHDPGIANYVRDQNIQDPDWVLRAVERRRARDGFWLVPRTTLLRRLRQLCRLGAGRAIQYLPVALGALLFDLWVFFAANRALGRGALRQAW